MSTTWGPTQIAGTGDDAYDDNRDGGVDVDGLDSDGWQFGASGSNYRDVGLRFQNVTIPQGATIDSATIQVYRSYCSGDGPYLGTMYCEDVDSAVDFSTNNNLCNRVKTTASVTWDAPTGEDGWIDSPDLKTIVQEVIDRDGWESGNDIMFIWWSGNNVDTKFMQAEDYSTGSALAAKLTIEYTEAAGGSSIVPIVMQYYRGLRA